MVQRQAYERILGIAESDTLPTASDIFHELLDSRRYDQAFAYMIEDPSVLDDFTVAELRLIYHQCFQGLISRDQESQFFRVLEERVRSTDI